MVLLDLEGRLDSHDFGLSDFGLPVPTLEEMNDVQHVYCTQPAIIREELDFNVEDLEVLVAERVPTFTPEQLEVYEVIMNAVENHAGIEVLRKIVFWHKVISCPAR